MVKQRPEQVETTLAKTINDTTDRMEVASPAGFPTAPGFFIRIEEEVLHVVAGAGTPRWSVTRGDLGTEAERHDTGVPVIYLPRSNRRAGRPFDGATPVSQGGTGEDLSTTGGPGQYVKQLTVGGDLAPGPLDAGDLTGNVADPGVLGGGTASGSTFLAGNLQWVTIDTAPSGAKYVTVASDDALSEDRVLTGQDGVVTIQDGGVDNGVTVGIATGGIASHMLRDSAANSVIGNTQSTLSPPQDISPTADGQYLSQQGGTLGFGSIAPGDVPPLDASIITSGQFTNAGLLGTGTASGITFLSGNLQWVAIPPAASPNAQYLTLADDPSLLQNRILVPQDGVLTIGNDSGPGEGITIGIATGGITNSLLRDSLATSVIGRSSSTTSQGMPGDIQATADYQVLWRSGGALLFAPLNIAAIDTSGWDIGDILVFNGTSLVRLPVGATNGMYLVSDDTQPTGLRWSTS